MPLLTHLRASLLCVLSVLPGSASGLMVTGSIREGAAVLDPAFVVEHLAGETPEPGPYTVRLLDSAGNVLKALPFRTSSIFVCGDGPCRAVNTSFSLVLPLPAELGSLFATVEVMEGERSLGRLRSTAYRPSLVGNEAQAVAPLPAGREPKAVSPEKGKVRLTWDATVHPRVMVKNSDGVIIASSATGEAEFATDSTRLELLLSDGLRTLTCRVPVQAAAP